MGLKQGFKFVKMQTEKKWAGMASLLDSNAAVKQFRRAITGKDTSLISGIHGLEKVRLSPTIPSCCKVFHEMRRGTKSKAFLKSTKQQSSFCFACLPCCTSV